MITRITRLVLAAAIAAGLSLPTLAAAEDSGAASANETLVVGTKIARPFVMTGADGKLTGLTVELWEKIAADLGIAYDYKDYDLDELLLAVAEGEVDIAVAALTITEARKVEMAFTEPYFVTGWSVAVPQDRAKPLAAQITGINDLTKLRVGSLSTSRGESYLAQRGIVNSPLPTVNDGLKALAEGKLDVFFHDSPILRYDVEQGYKDQLVVLTQKFGQQSYAFATPRGSYLIAEMNEALSAFLGTPEWTAMQRRYLPEQLD